MDPPKTADIRNLVGRAARECGDSATRLGKDVPFNSHAPGPV
jgi:hypothetical protein